MTDLQCKPAYRLTNLRSALWSMLGMPPDSSDGEIIAAVRSLVPTPPQVPVVPRAPHPFVLAVIDEDAP